MSCRLGVVEAREEAAGDRFLMASQKSRILVIGGTGYFGKLIVKESARAGNPTVALVREGTASDPAKAKLLEDFTAAGVVLVHGDLYDHESLVKAIKEVDVVISTVGFDQLADQTNIIAAIKQAGNIKRFLPSEFGYDADRINVIEPAKRLIEAKVKIRRAIEAENIPYTYVVSHLFAGYFLQSLGQAIPSFPTDKVAIFSDGNAIAVFNDEDDIATYTIKAVDDPRTLNKNLYITPPANIYSHNELVSLWEKKSGKKLERVYVSEQDLLKQIDGAPVPLNIRLAIHHTTFVKRYDTKFYPEPNTGVEASQLYPDVKYITTDEYLNRFL
ncbi:Isoflavone reductase-like protein [Apostasia shenzhenica]|uniref:Isoflavone reductase-like protein n=1 Tax=Apostasia shenzhenica TaxID=1088818 RepID=A0A2I0AEA8_9ASPA|nr:Isoflavone reductase-like protein [Apostasia shenzhenica]